MRCLPGAGGRFLSDKSEPGWPLKRQARCAGNSWCLDGVGLGCFKVRLIYLLRWIFFEEHFCRPFRGSRPVVDRTRG